MHILFLPTLI